MDSQKAYVLTLSQSKICLGKLWCLLFQRRYRERRAAPTPQADVQTFRKIQNGISFCK
ncbi:hypothetical protein H1Q63_27280 [Desmonostoc muscorum CCALA 125]|nr:hypothetical protein [Desmonostoc muscorum CCALA 125]